MLTPGEKRDTASMSEILDRCSRRRRRALDVTERDEREVAGVQHGEVRGAAEDEERDDASRALTAPAPGDHAGRAEVDLPAAPARAAARRSRLPPAARIRSAVASLASCRRASSSAPTSWSTSAAPCRSSGSSASRYAETTGDDRGPDGHERLAGRLAHPPRLVPEPSGRRSLLRRRRRSPSPCGSPVRGRYGWGSREGGSSTRRSASVDPRCSKGLERSRPDVWATGLRQRGATCRRCEIGIHGEQPDRRRSGRGRSGGRAAG